ncbi:hypothetical protein FDA77_19400 [Clostridium botulinum]|nr:hypothetical protein [Clostridium botulinum]NFJ91985.1 hypothetical protein [Clostridium botulinum]NFR74471.1 hypothetical protein [Clostridium botulinum]
MENKVKDSIGMKTPFFQTPNNIFDEEFMIIETTKDGVTKRYLKSFEKLVLIYLCRCGNNGQAIFPGYGDIAKKCCISRRSAINAIEILKENNFIVKQKRFKKKKNKEDYVINTSNEYTINLDLLIPCTSAGYAPPPSAPDALPLVQDMHHPSALGAPKKELYKKNNINIYSLVVNHLNKKCGTNYKSTTKKTQNLINARLREDFTVEDFYTVIDTKVKDWKGQITADGKNMENFLRPETLFGNKFEGYLNQKNKKVSTNEKVNNNAYKKFEFD